MKTLVVAFLVLACLVLLVSEYPYEDRQYLGGHGVRLSYDNRGYGGGYGRGYGGGYYRDYGGHGGYDKY